MARQKPQITTRKTEVEKIMTIKGLSQIEAKRLLKRYGENALKIKQKKPLIVKFLEEFKDLMVIILIMAALFSITAGEYNDGGVILFIVLLNAVIGFIQKFKAEKAVEALKKLVSPHAKVIRDGKLKEIKAKLLVPGDIVILGEGDSIPADGKLIEANDLITNEATLTGESIPIQKNRNDKVYMGTEVTHGSGKIIIQKTGMNTRFGHIAHLTTTTKKDLSPLQKELNKIGIFVGKTTLMISGILIFIGMFFQNQSFVHALLFATAVAVAAVPEGLPATITIALALGVQRLAKKKAIVKQLSSIETLGAVTVICSDKTGTITKNEMSVQEIFTFHETDTFARNLIGQISKYCSDAKLEKERNKWKIIGDQTEGALLIAIHEFKLKTHQARVLQKIPFDSIDKTMSVVTKEGKNLFSLVKGAPDSIIDKCEFILIDGKKHALDAGTRKILNLKNEKMAGNALRVLGFAYKEIHVLKKKYKKDETENALIFVGLAGMLDPPRPEVKKAIELSKKAGIRTYIVTGDHGLTARAIAKKIGLADDHTRIITGDNLDKINQIKLKKLLKSKEPIIFARIKPEHKLRLVEALKKLGEIVAVTGDGVNDAPALKRADIGVAMGITGTDVSREAANMVLANDSYGTIINAIEEGRKIYENLKKFVFYIFSCNIGELLTVFTGILLGLPAPLTAVLILAVDLGTDVLPAIALGIDSAEKGIMERPPRDQNKKIMNKGFIIRYIYIGTVIGITVISIFIYGLNSHQDPSIAYLKASTMAFVTLVFIQMINAFNVRSESISVFAKTNQKNPWLLGAVIISIIFTFSFVEIEFLQNFLKTTSLTIKEWLILGMTAFVVLIAEETRKLFKKRFYAG